MHRLQSLIRVLLGQPDPEDIVLGRPLSEHRHRQFRIDRKLQDAHILTLGITGRGKSRGVLVPMYLQRYRKRPGVMLIDPPGATAEDLLAYLVQDQGKDLDDSLFDKLIHIKFSEDHVPALNILKNPRVSAASAAHGVRDALVRVFPELEHAPMFENLVRPAARLLVENNLPLPLMGQLLLSPELRHACLQNCDDYTTHQVMNRLPEDDPERLERVAGSILRRISTINFDPISFASLLGPGLALPFRDILDSGTSVIVDLGDVHSPEIRRFIASIIMTSVEQAVVTRSDTPENERRPYRLIVDEYPAIAPDPVATEIMTAQMRKYGMALTMVGQSIFQFQGDRFAAALENCNLNILLGLGHGSAETMAREIAQPDSDRLKFEALTETQHEEFWSHKDQFEELVQDLQHMPPRRAIVTERGQPPVAIELLDVPDPQPDPGMLREAKEEFRSRYHSTPDEAKAKAAEAIAKTGLPVDLSMLTETRPLRLPWTQDAQEIEFGEPIKAPETIK